MGNYSKALVYHEQALDIFQRLLPANHPDLLIVRKGIEHIKTKI
jgi:hypothetical protein